MLTRQNKIKYSCFIYSNLFDFFFSPKLKFNVCFHHSNSNKKTKRIELLSNGIKFLCRYRYSALYEHLFSFSHFMQSQFDPNQIREKQSNDCSLSVEYKWCQIQSARTGNVRPRIESSKTHEKNFFFRAPFGRVKCWRLVYQLPSPPWLQVKLRLHVRQLKGMCIGRMGQSARISLLHSLNTLILRLSALELGRIYKCSAVGRKF